MNKTVMKNANTMLLSRVGQTFGVRFSVCDGVVSADGMRAGVSAFDTQGHVFFPGFCDVHVHFREPGFSYKETMETGSMAGARGGYTAVCTMPNLNPVPDSAAHLAEQQALIEAGARIHVYPYGSITVGQKGEVLSDLRGMADKCIAFSDDGRGVQSESMMRSAMETAKSLGKMIVAHCEVNDLLFGGYIHDGQYAKAHGHRGICSESEYAHIARDIKLSKETGCPYHVCHISAKESVALIREAKAEGVNITCETAPHYLVMDDGDLCEDGRFKMNPPLRDQSDREALLEGLLDGTIDMIATDHAPHSAEEKSRGLEKSAFGIVGLETALPVLYTYLVKPGILSLDKLCDVLVINPRKRFDIPMSDEWSVWDMSESFTVDPAEFLSMGKATPFAGHTLYGRNKMTVINGQVVWKE